MFMYMYKLDQASWWFLVSDGCEILASVEQLNFHLKHMLPTFSYFNKVLCIRGMWVGYFSIHKLLTLQKF